MSAKYDIIGINYTGLRRPDWRIARIIESALGSAETVLNVGAGTGSYEPTDRSVIAVEPSREMIQKRSSAAARAIQASADDLPFDDKSFDASMAILTIHRKRSINPIWRASPGSANLRRGYGRGVQNGSRSRAGQRRGGGVAGGGR
jgi:ubiquinone/menaquinone biosynthesis C-methylase UbiE